MNKRVFVLCTVCVATAFALGFLTAEVIRAEPAQTYSFYARVLECRENVLLVEGIPENDVNHRSKYYVSMKDGGGNNILDKDGRAIGFADIPVGSLAWIEYDGIVLESYPGQIHGAVLIQLAE